MGILLAVGGHRASGTSKRWYQHPLVPSFPRSLPPPRSSPAPSPSPPSPQPSPRLASFPRPVLLALACQSYPRRRTHAMHPPHYYSEPIARPIEIRLNASLFNGHYSFIRINSLTTAGWFPPLRVTHCRVPAVPRPFLAYGQRNNGIFWDYGGGIYWNCLVYPAAPVLRCGSRRMGLKRRGASRPGARALLIMIIKSFFFSRIFF